MPVFGSPPTVVGSFCDSDVVVDGVGDTGEAVNSEAGADVVIGFGTSSSNCCRSFVQPESNSAEQKSEIEYLINVGLRVSCVLSMWCILIIES